MIFAQSTRIWTSRGYRLVDDLFVGDRVISFNPARGCCEYDEIKSIEVEYKRCQGMGISSKSMRQVLTPDHDLLFWDAKHKKLERIPIEQKFMIDMLPGRNKSVLMAALFEPYMRTQDEADIRWHARMSASYSTHWRAHIDPLWGLGGYEAQLWIDSFFHWHRLLPEKNWMATVKLTNNTVAGNIFDIAPRAGVGVKWTLNFNKNRVSVTNNGFVYPLNNNSWFKRPIDGAVFNVTTRNGNFLAKVRNGTCLVACKGE